MKNLFLCALVLIINSNLFSQTVEQVKADNLNYYWGEGTGSTLKKADDEALSMLISQISTSVESYFEILKQESGSQYKEKVNSVVRTYSSSTLKNTERISISDEPNARVFRYVKRSEVYKIFAERREKIIDFTENAGVAADKLQIADALKYYYWAFMLLRSHPDCNSIKFTNGELMAVWLPAQLNLLFAGITVTLGELTADEGFSTQTLNINYKGLPVANFDYSYWDGKNWSNTISAKDGLGFVEFSEINPAIKEVKLKIEYMFDNEASVDKELFDVMQKLDPVAFQKSSIIAKPKTSKQAADTLKSPENIIVDDKTKASEAKSNSTFTQVTDPTPYLKAVNQLKEAIRKTNYESAKPLFTANGFDIFTKLVQYGKARILTDKELVFLKNGDEVFCRAIPMNFNFLNNKQFVEELVLNFDVNKKISNLSFALGDKAISDITAKTIWPEKVRAQLINFMEDYKTAYALKRLDYFERIFSDDALIIVGSLLKIQTGDMTQYKDNKILKYNHYTKQEYLKRLKYAFNSKEYINLKFEDNEIRKSGKKPETYGIQIRQNFYSSNYSDAGYLFLLIDFDNPDLPVIHVRTWQPEKNPDGSIYGLNDFN